MKKSPLQRPRRILRMAAIEDKVGLKESQIREKIARGHVPEACPALGVRPRDRIPRTRARRLLDERIAERDRGYVPSASEVARIEASREGRRKAREARAAEHAATAHKPHSRKRAEATA